MTKMDLTTEAIVQFELYTTIREIFQTQGSTRTILTETRKISDSKQLLFGITICNDDCGMIGYEIITNKQSNDDIEIVVKHADDFRRIRKMDQMFGGLTLFLRVTQSSMM